MPDLNTTLTDDHPGWTLEIKGQLANPSDRTRLEGGKTETIMEERDAWLTAMGNIVSAGQFRDDGTLLPVPVKVTTTWDLRRVR
jgi:hypothetical protein